MEVGGEGEVDTRGAGGGCSDGDPIAGVPANIMRVKETVIDEEELIKQRVRESEGERLINQERCPPASTPPPQPPPPLLLLLSPP